MKDKFQYIAKQTAFYSCPCCGWEWYETRPAYCYNCEVKLTYEQDAPIPEEPTPPRPLTGLIDLDKAVDEMIETIRKYKNKQKMKTAELNDYLMYNGTLHKVTGVMTGKTIIMEEIIEDANEAFVRGTMRPGPIHILEHCNDFQEGAEPVGTLGEDCLEPKAKRP